MPSEPLEAEFAVPPALSTAQEDALRQFEKESPLSGTSAAGSVAEIALSHEGIHIVTFEEGKREDPREWSHGKKW